MADQTALAESAQAIFCAYADYIGDTKAQQKLNIKTYPNFDTFVRKEKKDFELLKTKESKSDLFGPLTNKETERLQNLSIKREKDKDANY